MNYIHLQNHVPNSINDLDQQELDRIRNEFVAFGSGSLDLDMSYPDGIAVITINNYVKRNSFSGKMIAQFDSILTQLESWSTGKAVILRGSNGFFSSGGDLTTVSALLGDPDGGRRMNLLMQSNFLRLQRLPLITVALIEGKAIGGGAETCTACDWRIMTPSAEIGFVHVRMGITAGWGGGSRLVNIVGPGKALELFTSAKRLSSKEALSIGLTNHVLDCDSDASSEQVLSKAKEWLSQFTWGDHEPIQACKKIISAAQFTSLDQALSTEAVCFSQVWGKPSHVKAMSSNVKHK